MLCQADDSRENGEGIYRGTNDKQKQDNRIVINDRDNSNDSATGSPLTTDKQDKSLLKPLDLEARGLVNERLVKARAKLKRSTSCLEDSAARSKVGATNNSTGCDLQSDTQFVLDSLDQQLEQFGQTQRLYLDRDRKFKFQRALSDLQRRPQINEINFGQLFEEHARRSLRLNKQVGCATKPACRPEAATNLRLGSSTGGIEPSVRSNVIAAPLKCGTFVVDELQSGSCSLAANNEDLPSQRRIGQEPCEALDFDESFSLEYENILPPDNSNDDDYHHHDEIVKLNEDSCEPKSFQLLGHGDGLFIVEDVNNDDNIITVNDGTIEIDGKGQNYRINRKQLEASSQHFQGQQTHHSSGEYDDRWSLGKLVATSELQVTSQGSRTGEPFGFGSPIDYVARRDDDDDDHFSGPELSGSQLSYSQSTNRSDETNSIRPPDNDRSVGDGFCYEFGLGKEIGSALEGVVDLLPSGLSDCTVSLLSEGHALSSDSLSPARQRQDSIAANDHFVSNFWSVKESDFVDHKTTNKQPPGGPKFHRSRSLASDLEASKGSHRVRGLSRAPVIEGASWRSRRASSDLVRSSKQLIASSSDENHNLIDTNDDANNFYLSNIRRFSVEQTSNKRRFGCKLDQHHRRRRRRKKRKVNGTNNRSKSEKLSGSDDSDKPQDGNELSKSQDEATTTIITRANSISYWLELEDKRREDRDKSKSNDNKSNKKIQENRAKDEFSGELSALNDEMKLAKDLAKTTAPSLSSVQLLSTNQLKQFLSSSLPWSSSSDDRHQTKGAAKSKRRVTQRARYLALNSQRFALQRRLKLIGQGNGNRWSNNNNNNFNKSNFKKCNMETGNVFKFKNLLSPKKSMKSSSLNDLKDASSQVTASEVVVRESRDKLKKRHKSLNTLCLCCLFGPNNKQPQLSKQPSTRSSSFLSRSLSKLSQRSSSRQSQPEDSSSGRQTTPASDHEPHETNKLLAPSIILSAATQDQEPEPHSGDEVQITAAQLTEETMCLKGEQEKEEDARQEVPSDFVRRIDESLEELDKSESFALDKLDQTSDRLDELADLLNSAPDTVVQRQAAKYQRLKANAEDVRSLTRWIQRANGLFERKLGSASDSKQLHKEMVEFFSPTKAPRISVSLCPALDGQYRECLTTAKQRIMTIEQVLKNWDQYYETQRQLKGWLSEAESKLVHAIDQSNAESNLQQETDPLDDLMEFFELERSDDPLNASLWRSDSNEFIFPFQNLGPSNHSSGLMYGNRSLAGSVLSLASNSSRISLPLQTSRRAKHTKLFEEFELRCSLLAAMVEADQRASLLLTLRELRNQLSFIVDQRVPQLVGELKARCMSTIEPEVLTKDNPTESIDKWPIWHKIKRAYKASFTLNIALLICLVGICIVPIWHRDACCELSPKYPIPIDDTFGFNEPKPT